MKKVLCLILVCLMSQAFSQTSTPSPGTTLPDLGKALLKPKPTEPKPKQTVSLSAYLASQVNLSESQPTGFAVIKIFGGSGSYLCKWSDGQTGHVAKNLKAGFYTATVTDSFAPYAPIIQVRILPADFIKDPSATIYFKNYNRDTIYSVDTVAFIDDPKNYISYTTVDHDTIFFLNDTAGNELSLLIEDIWNNTTLKPGEKKPVIMLVPNLVAFINSRKK